MAKKKFVIKQERKFNNDSTVATATYECEESEVTAIVQKLEGIVTVLEENVGLGNGAENNTVTTGLPIDGISMVHSEAKTKFFGAYGKPLLFKATTSVLELQELFKLHKPFTGAYETEKPDAVYPKVGNIGKL